MKLRIKNQDLKYEINYPNSPHQFPDLKITSKWTELTDVIFKLSEIPPEDQMILYYSSELKDPGEGQNLSNVGIHDDMELRLADRKKNIKVTIILLDGTEVEVYYNNEEYAGQLKQRIEQLGGPMKLTYYRMSLILERNNTKLIDYHEARYFGNGARIRQVRASFTTFGSDDFMPSEEMDCITLELPKDPIDFPHCKMPCGHVFSQDTIREILIRKVRDEKAHEIRCPALKEGRVHQICNALWDYPDLPDYFTMTADEETVFKDSLHENIHLFVLNYIQCPTCQVLIPKPSDDPKLTRTHCEKCEQTEGGKADFCYKCGEEWKNGIVCQSDHCTFKKQNAILQECIEIEVEEQTVPAVRACPNCKTLYEHMEACRHMKCKSFTCKDSKFEYCHICLADWSEHDHDSCNVAPRQVLEFPYQQIIEEEKKEEEQEGRQKEGALEIVKVKEDNLIEEEPIPETFTDDEEIQLIQREEEVERLIQQNNVWKLESVSTDQTDYNEHYMFAGLVMCPIQ
ncbi:hypothetical protein FGO68_gene3865 [Halteria grandinella]|uniref:RING-type domain-containing protein n=1 Tax=Halteria grandinella TaxID=5974 RepID=A0A8J8NTI9_HALGN|nr:hypothetical protein FGO68_gene3865 [Halteria grandinella]